MSLYATPEEHAANPPSSWRVDKRGERSWALVDANGAELERHATKRDAEAARSDGFAARLYEREGRWFAGYTPVGQKSWAQCKAERERIAARWATP